MKGLRLGVVRHFYERENAANAATREAIDAVGNSELVGGVMLSSTLLAG